MILGKITVQVENISSNKTYYCRPVALANGELHPRIVGVCQVVYLERNREIDNLRRDDIVTVYGIFSRKHTIEEFRRGFTKVKVSPIDEETFYRLRNLYPNIEHCFSV